MKDLKSGKVNAVLTAAILVLLLIALLAWLLLGKGCGTSATPALDETVPEEPTVELAPKEIEPPSAPSIVVEQTPLSNPDPSTLMASIKSTLEEGDLQKFTDAIGRDKFTPEQLVQLDTLKSKYPEANFVIREVGEVEINKHTRWAIGIEGEDSEITIDIVKQVNGEWTVQSLDLNDGASPTDASSSGLTTESDSLSIADQFLKAMLKLDFEKALEFTNAGNLSDARIASLCIMFEEGNYALRANKPLRSNLQRELVSLYTANVESSEGEEKGQFGIKLDRESSEADWKVSEINVDKLLEDYIERVAGGDAYYTPLVQNPEGGDTLALYFDFNEGGLSSRAERQLDIIASLLKTDPTKKLTLSGHADALGSDDYNNELSLSRAEAVRSYLVSQGISDTQIQILAYGETKPRRDNDTDQGRRANRRTELYLDF